MRKGHNYARLMDAIGDGREWEYTGVCNDTRSPEGSACACGHPIRFEFIIRRPRDGAEAILGSSCIKHFSEANPELHARLTEAHEGLMERVKAAEAEVKAQTDAQDLERLKACYDAALQAVEDLKRRAADERRYPATGLVFLLSRKKLFQGPPEYSRACDTKRWYERATGEINRTLEALPPFEMWQRKPIRRTT